MGPTLRLAAGEARVALAPEVGGAIASFSWRGRDALRPRAADAQGVRDLACFPLVPYSNRIEHGRLAYGDRTHALALNFGAHPHAIHGVGWQCPWTVDAHDDAFARLSFTHDARGAAARAWPWPFRAWQTFALAATAAGATLTLKLGLENTSDAPFPFGLGWHPYFPCGPATTLQFAATGFWETDATCVPTRRVAPAGERRFDAAPAIGTTRLDNVYAGWDGRATLADPARAIAVDIAADRACPFLVVYIAASGDFCAIEPVTQMTDAFNRAARGDADTGTRVLEPGAAFSCTMTLSARTLP